jgi:iron complex outermembrane recepter protein
MHTRGHTMIESTQQTRAASGLSPERQIDVEGQTQTGRTRVRHSISLAVLGLATFGFGATVAHAQTEAPAPAAEPEIVVTGTRIARTGYAAPTPVSVINAKDIQATAPANVADFVNTLPSIAGSATANNSSGSLSNGQAGISSLNLRALGTARTLVLLDSKRSPASSTQGTVDVNTFPQGLIERVEVVTGGASAAYGSDAVGGVVNFVLNNKFRGLKMSYDYGVTTYGDVPNHKLTVTGGDDYFGGKLSVLFNAEYFEQSGKDTIDRDWNDAGFFQIDNPAYTATNGAPARLIGGNIGPSNMTPGGLVTTGALRGTYFGAIDPVTGKASVNQLTFGAVNGSWMQGGDYLITRAGHLSSNSLAPTEERDSLFVKLAYDITPDFTVYTQLSYNKYNGQSFYQQTPSTGVVIQKDNAYLPTEVFNKMTTAGLTSISIGTSNAGIPAAGSDNTREVTRYVVGAEGKFGLFGDDWKWDAYYQKGIVDAHELLTNTWNNARMALAQDAVVAPVGNTAGIAAGSIVCRSTLTAPTNGCVPINRIGIGGVTQAALNYIFWDQPFRDQKIQEDVAAISFNGEPFMLPAGPVSVAFGTEWRKEQVSGQVETRFNTGWLYGNYLVNKGSYTVTESFLELAIPIIEGLDISAAGRMTDYSTSGKVETWKLGTTYAPVKSLKFRATMSHDIRAPNLSEFFAAGTARTNTVVDPRNATSPQFTEKTTGNLALTPEIADSTNFGIVFTPSFISGFAASVDYYEIEIADAIGTISAQDTVDQCYIRNVAELCSRITLNASNVITEIALKPINFSKQRSRGLDLEMSYRFALSQIDPHLPGKLNLRGLFTHYIENYTNNGISVATDTAGQNTGNGPPSLIYRLTAAYDLDPFTFNLTARGLSDGVYDNSYVVCTSGCPASTLANRTVNYNTIKGALYIDTALSRSFTAGGRDGEIQFTITNLFNRDPSYVGNGPTGNNTPAYPQTNRNFYDVLGRTYRMSLRFKM